MKKSIIVKATSMSALSLIVGCYFYIDEMKKSALGKGEYLKMQSIRFDHTISHPHISIIIGTLFLGIILFGLYEIICLVIIKIINKMEKKSNSF